MFRVLFTPEPNEFKHCDKFADKHTEDLGGRLDGSRRQLCSGKFPDFTHILPNSVYLASFYVFRYISKPWYEEYSVDNFWDSYNCSTCKNYAVVSEMYFVLTIVRFPTIQTNEYTIQQLDHR